MFKKLKRPIVVTHSGSFHADDICAVAVLELLFELRGCRSAKVLRSRDAAVIESADFVVDVGGVYDPNRNRFDHHQVGGAGLRANGVPYASIGLVWKHFGRELCGGEVSVVAGAIAEQIDREVIQPIDAIDNGVEMVTPLIPDLHPYSFGGALSSFLPSWKELHDVLDGSSIDKMFLQAVAIAKAVFKREITKAKDNEEGRRLAEKVYEATVDKRFVVFPESYPWSEVLAVHHDTLYAIYPQGTRWHVKAVRSDRHSFKVRKGFPASWAGKRDAELVRITGVKDAAFCHNKLFLVVAESKAGALALTKLALEA